MYLPVVIGLIVAALPTPADSHKELKFIHITKTGGTSIELAGLAKGLKWGKFDTQYRPSTQFRGAFWHIPFSHLPSELKSQYDWFMVVRNPYERILSEYYCQWGGVGKLNITHTQRRFNAFISRRIRARGDRSQGHYIEQVKYLDTNTTQHVLRYEELPHAFDALMKKYGINVRLRRVHNARVPGKFTTAHFSAELVKLIKKVYARDFEEFGYDPEQRGGPPSRSIKGVPEPQLRK